MPQSILITDPTDIQSALRERTIAYEIGGALRRHYPGRDWIVRIDAQQAIASIHCLQVSMTYGVVVHLDTIIHEITAKAVRLAGELLERYQLSRCRDEWQDIHERRIRPELC